jgi:hypothetical protein
MMATQKERRTISLKGKPSILRDVGKHMRTCISLMKQLGLLVSTLSMIVKNFHVIEENTNQYGR